MEEFFQNLNDVESLILDRESTPRYTAEFKLPQDSLDGSKTETTTTRISWPIFKDGWNIKIGGFDYVNYLERLNDIGDEVDQYKSNLISRFLTTASLSEFDTEDQRMASIFQIYGSGFDSVKKFIEIVCKQLSINISWKGKGLKEIGYWQNKPIIKIDPKYFRPTEVESLLGSSKKAKKILKWSPKYNIQKLVKEMIDYEFSK